MIDDPFRVLIEQRRAWMYVNLLIICNCTVALLGVFPARMSEKASTDGLPNLRVVFISHHTARECRQLEPLHDRNQLLSHILRPFEGSCLHEIVKAPGIRAALGLPRFVDS